MTTYSALLTALTLTISPLISPFAIAQSKTQRRLLRGLAHTHRNLRLPLYSQGTTRRGIHRRVVAAAPEKVKIEPWGKTGEGRELVGVVVSKDGVSIPLHS